MKLGLIKSSALAALVAVAACGSPTQVVEFRDDAGGDDTADAGHLRLDGGNFYPDASGDDADEPTDAIAPEDSSPLEDTGTHSDSGEERDSASDAESDSGSTVGHDSGTEVDSGSERDASVTDSGNHDSGSSSHDSGAADSGSHMDGSCCADDYTACTSYCSTQPACDQQACNDQCECLLRLCEGESVCCNL